MERVVAWGAEEMGEAVLVGVARAVDVMAGWVVATVVATVVVTEACIAVWQLLTGRPRGPTQ